MWEEPRQSEFRHWPLCYTWIGYHRSMVRLELYCLKSVDHNYCAVIVRVVDSWTFIICLAPHRYPRKMLIHFLLFLHRIRMPGSRTNPRYAVRSILDAGIRVRYPASRNKQSCYIPCHHTPDKAWQFPCNSSRSNITFRSEHDLIKFAF